MSGTEVIRNCHGDNHNLMLLSETKGIAYSVKENQLDAQLILSIFRQPLHVSGVSRPIIRRYNRMYTTISTYSF
jgi:hypothetical protein